jgi:23S rRNA pseudouridine1911/1915/1917 synthase
MTLRERLHALFPEASGRSLKRWLESGRVRLNGRPVRDGRRTLAPGDQVALGPAAPPSFPGPLRRVYEDDALLIVDKPPGLLTVASERERVRTVYRLLWDYLAGQDPPRRPFIVHRLDRDTSGLLIFAKSPAAKRHLQAQFKSRTAERVYVAVVAGRLREDRGVLVSRLVEDRGLRVRPVRDRGAGGRGARAITHYRVLARRRDATLVELRLGTGRRHQLRVQLAALGHPIAGDRLHGGARPGAAGRLCLHASRLGLVHPVTGEALRAESAPPAAWV